MSFVSLHEGSSNLQNQVPSATKSTDSLLITFRIFSHATSYRIIPNQVIPFSYYWFAPELIKATYFVLHKVIYTGNWPV